MPSIGFDSGDAFRVASDLTIHGVAAGAKVWGVTQHYGLLLQTTVKAFASKPRSGPPGPRIQTGDYVRSISLTVGTSGGGVSATVGTNRPQGRRLEFGFVGTDSIGRSYAQPPYPHFGPALGIIGPQYVAAVAAAVAS